MKKLLLIALLLLLPASARSQWTATSKGSQVDGGTIRIFVVFTNAGNTITKEFDYSGTSDIASALQNDVTSTINSLNAVSGYNAAPGIIAAKTQPVIDTTAQQLSQAIALLQSAQRAVSLGIITTQSTEYQTAFKAVQTLYQPQYLGLF